MHCGLSKPHFILVNLYTHFYIVVARKVGVINYMRRCGEDEGIELILAPTISSTHAVVGNSVAHMSARDKLNDKIHNIPDLFQSVNTLAG